MLHTEEISYETDNVTCRGYIAYDKENPQPKPCVLIAHDWSGQNDFARQKAEQLAKMGYVGFAIDMYGNGRTGKTTEEKQALMMPLMQNRPLIAKRMQGALDKASTLSFVDPRKIAAIGFCFGGLCALDLARSGANINGVISFHGLLMSPEITQCEKVTAKILVLHGHDDPLAPPEQVKQFINEMKTKRADWQIHLYGQTQHAFTNPEANDAQLGLHYDAVAAKRSWQSATDFFKEIFAN